MKTTQPILECVPNFSEGRDEKIIQAIADEVRSTSFVELLHIDTSPAANRTVLTFAGEPQAITEAAFKAIDKAAQLIDMSVQEGVHPRIGATDVCPLVPLYNMTMEDAVYYSRQLGDRVGKELNIPVYLYEYSASAAHRKSLPQIRKGQYEGLEAKMKDERWQPDFGPKSFHKKTGATVIGARDVLVAFNIALQTKEINIAHEIAKQMRESGYVKMTNGVKEKVPGQLKRLRAIGWYMQDYELAQVSFNLLDYRVTSPWQVWKLCQQLAFNYGVSLVGSEVIGLIPEGCLLEAGAGKYQGEIASVTKDQLISAAIQVLGLAQLKPFQPEEKVLETVLRKHQLIG